MGWFRKDPPPPPPPKNTLVTFLQISIPVVFMIMIGLLGIVYNGLAEEVKSKADKEVTYKAIEANQNILKEHQKTLDETLRVIVKIQTERELQKEYKQQPEAVMSSPSGFGVIQQQEKPPLSPKEFQEYLKLSPDDRAAFRSLHPSYQSLPK